MLPAKVDHERVEALDQAGQDRLPNVPEPGRDHGATPVNPRRARTDESGAERASL
jgi:hypothetical protein